ncbi:hypothetical protein [Rodentibacter pneumotropicus]|uniref:hypothetical protein n=1 Tax=Rodentibacter pneumotropicus TaxID=758 RepID=UPI00098625B7|nr:hypothetical protein [Rodentibacter pneumotropicus]OOF62906.1 hypothetical protein BKL50_04720 [Rodentibacter pneumotropicus]
MKKLILFVVSLFLLFGCTTTDKKEVSKQSEVIQAFFIANNNIYAIGNLNSYQFSSEKSEYVQYLIDFLNSQEMKAFKSVHINEIERNVEDNKINASLFIELDGTKLTKDRVQELLNNRDVYKPSQDNLKLLFKLSNGTTVILQNKDEILSKGKLSTPLKTYFIEYKNSVKINTKDTTEGFAMAVVWGGAGIITLPFAIISLPFQAFSALSK